MSVGCFRCCLTSLPLHAEAHSGSKGTHPGHTVSTLSARGTPGLLSCRVFYHHCSCTNRAAGVVTHVRNCWELSRKVSLINW